MWIEMIIPEIVAIKNSRYVDSYPANIFKNAGKCKQIKDDLVAKNLI